MLSLTNVECDINKKGEKIKVSFYKKWHSKTPVITEKAVAMDNKVRGAELHPSASHSQYSILIL